MSEPQNYVLVTAAYNEEAYIEKTIQSVIAQTVQPLQWAIVSDGSTDRTDEIVLSYAARHPFIRLVRVQEEHARNFAAQVHAINLGCKSLQSLQYRFIANLDSDVSFGPTYFQKLIDKFDRDSNLGLAGGYIFEESKGGFKSRPTNRNTQWRTRFRCSVANASKPLEAIMRFRTEGQIGTRRPPFGCTAGEFRRFLTFP